MANFPTDTVTIDLGDGRARELRYTMAALRRLKAKFGKSALTGEFLKSMDEDRLPDLIFEGLVDREGIDSADALAEIITAPAVNYLIRQFSLAYTGSFPDAPVDQKNDQSSQSATI